MPWQLISGGTLPDTEQGLVAKAFEKNCSVIASYSIIPTSPRITLEIQERGGSSAPLLGSGFLGWGCPRSAPRVLSPQRSRGSRP